MTYGRAECGALLVAGRAGAFLLPITIYLTYNVKSDKMLLVALKEHSVLLVLIMKANNKLTVEP